MSSHPEGLLADTVHERYAVYWAPPAGSALELLGAAWLGHDPARPGAPGPRDTLGLDSALADRVTAEPRRYGLHATLKAPFRLAAGVAPARLEERLGALARRLAAFEIPPLSLGVLDGFIALTPSAASQPLDALAAACVEDLDDLRAPLSAADRARRAKSGRLTPLQEELLERWGYPFVLSQFRFHVTLTGRLAEAERAMVLAALAPAVAPFCREPLAIREVALYGDPGGGAGFRLLRRLALSVA